MNDFVLVQSPSRSAGRPRLPLLRRDFILEPAGVGILINVGLPAKQVVFLVFAIHFGENHRALARG